MAVIPEFIDRLLDKIIKKIYKQNGEDLFKQPPYQSESLSISIQTKKWENVQVNGHKIFKNLDETEISAFCNVIDEYSITPFTITVAMKLFTKHSCKKLDQFLLRLVYVTKYIEYKRDDAVKNPKVFRVARIFGWTMKSEIKDKRRKKVYIRYRDPNTRNFLSFDTYNLHYFGGFATIDHGSGGSGCAENGNNSCGNDNNCGSENGGCWDGGNNTSGGGCDSGGGDSGGCDSGGGDSGGGCDSGGGGSCD